MKVDQQEIESYIRELLPSKSPGLDGISSEHLKFCSRRILPLLSFLFGAILVHGIIPNEMIQSVITPVIKDKNGDITMKNNYRPIAISSIISKVFEKVILDRCSMFLNTSDHQFGFKRKHSTDLCIFALKETINFYRSKGNNVFVCFLDASKAFDRVNHWTLFKKLISKNVPVFIVRILSHWYGNQSFTVRWGSAVSESFKVSNGVPQGSNISPFLFNVYFDEFSVALCNSNIGCFINNQICNHFFYADDLCIICPSQKGLQKLVDLCVNVGHSLDVIFNPEKSKCMFFKSDLIKIASPLAIKINGQNVVYSTSEEYLGHVITNNLKDDEDIHKQRKLLYSRSNSLIRKLNLCSEETRAHLFKSFCSNLYCSPVWNDYTVRSFNSLKNAYNNSFTILMNLPIGYNCTDKFVNLCVPDFNNLIRRNINSFINRLFSSNNTILLSIVDSDIFYSSKILGNFRKLVFI